MNFQVGKKGQAEVYVKIVLLVGYLYLFLLSIDMMGTSMKMFGKGFSESLIASTSNPVVGLFIGVLATSLIQSSSTTTSIVVGMVGSNVITIHNAIPIIMGANIGTTVTCTLVALGHITRREEFKRAITGATLHDFFNIMCVCIFFPLQITTGFLEKLATKMVSLFSNFGGVAFTSPLKVIIKPAIHFMKSLFIELNLDHNSMYIILLVIATIMLFLSLFFIVKLMKQLIIGRVEIVLNNVLGKHGFLAIIAGIIFTAFVQSSSITTSLMIPLVGSGILTAETIFPITMGANIGTTVTAILASFATGNIAAITVAFSHFLFNLIGVCLIYPIKIFRKIPLALAKTLGNIAFKKRRYAILFMLSVYFLIPGFMIFVSRFFK